MIPPKLWTNKSVCFKSILLSDRWRSNAMKFECCLRSCLPFHRPVCFLVRMSILCLTIPLIRTSPLHLPWQWYFVLFHITKNRKGLSITEYSISGDHYILERSYTVSCIVDHFTINIVIHQYAHMFHENVLLTLIWLTYLDSWNCVLCSRWSF